VTITDILVAVNLALFFLAFMVVLDSLSTRRSLKKTILQLAEEEARCREVRIEKREVERKLTRAEFQISVYEAGVR